MQLRAGRSRKYNAAVLTPDSALRTQLRRIKYSVASMGLRRSFSDVATALLTYHPERDHSFDRRSGTDTAGSMAPSQLGIADREARDNAILYLPSPARVTRWMLEQIGIRHRDFTFVDLGCGKGRVLLVASEYPFQRIVGVEISAQLSQIARANADKYRPRSRVCQDIEVANTNATLFEFPETDILLHLYHPFETAITEAVLTRLQASISAKPRRVVVAYLTYTAAVAEVDELFARFPWLHKTRYEQSVLGQYNWMFYANSTQTRDARFAL